MRSASFWGKIMKDKDINTLEDLKNEVKTIYQVDTCDLMQERIIQNRKLREHSDWKQIFFTILNKYYDKPFTAKDLGINSNKLFSIAVCMGLDIISIKPYVFKLNIYKSYILTTFYKKEIEKVAEKIFSKNH